VVVLLWPPMDLICDDSIALKIAVSFPKPLCPFLKKGKMCSIHVTFFFFKRHCLFIKKIRKIKKQCAKQRMKY